MRRPRQWGACWVACGLWDLLQLDTFWASRLPPSRKGTRWLSVLKTLVAYRLIDPGSEWRLHRHWFDHSAMGELLGEDFAIAHSHTLYLASNDPVQLWTWYIQRTEVEQAFKELKGDLSIRPIDHQLETRIEAHSFVACLAYCLQVTLKGRLRPFAPGLTPRSALEKFAAIQMVDVHLPTTDGRTLILSHYTEPEPDQRPLLDRLNLQLAAQPPPTITAALQAVIH